uniref:Tick transposon n=1 Tax=Macrostomum lignano TaxID=282301 RepID=A0A1I8FLC6_9PLAT
KKWRQHSRSSDTKTRHDLVRLRSEFEALRSSLTGRALLTRCRAVAKVRHKITTTHAQHPMHLPLSMHTGSSNSAASAVEAAISAALNIAILPTSRLKQRSVS